MTDFRTETIRTDRLLLLPLRAGHAAEMAEVLADPELHAFTGGEPSSARTLRSRYRRLVAGSPDPDVLWGNWVIQLPETGRLTGYVQATVAGPVAEIAWVVGTPWQGRGLAKEAARALVGRLRLRHVDTVIAHIHPRHHASAAVARAAGLSPTDALHDGEVRWRLAFGGG